VLRLTWGGRERGAAPRQTTARTHCQHLVFGGVGFELLADESGKRRSVPPDSLGYCIRGFDARAVADVVCAVRTDASLPSRSDIPSPANAVLFAGSPGERGSIVLRSSTLHAELEPVSPRRYAVTARVAPGSEGMLALLRGVSAAILHREGGFVLHTAAVELDGQAVLFVGPSGAGKSTAVRLTRGGRCFAYDHAAVVPGPHGWLAWGLPGGSAVDAPMADGVVYPVAAVLRVRKADAGLTRISELSGTEALFALRESVEWADDSPGAEDVYLRAVTELSSTITVGSIATVLGRSTDVALRKLLRKRPQTEALLA
jgi:hypothetical protein